MFTDLEKIKYIKENIEYISQLKIAKFLGIHCRTLHKIIKDNNISDERLYRYCPTCNNKIFHKNIKERIRSEKDDRNCRKCEGFKKMEKYKGEGNPFYNKNHTDENKKLFHDIHKGKRYSINTEFKKGGKGNTINIYYLWVKKYGKEIADDKLNNFKSKQSKNNSGEGNPMYGKPSPIGSGNGWSGWYKGWYFRSLLELSYMIFVIERFNIKWESGEKKKNRIEYYINNKKRNYFPDFIINDKYVVECKPKKLWNTEINKLKFKYADEYCKSNNMIMKITDCSKINKEELISLYKSGYIVFIEKYKLRIEDIIRKSI